MKLQILKNLRSLINAEKRLLQKHNPDILCLQETTRHDQRLFIERTGHQYQDKTADGVFVKFGGCSILTKFPIVIRESVSKR